MAQTDTIRAQLRAMSEEGYADFQRRLVPCIEPERVLGVRTPALRALAKQLAGTPTAEMFLHETPHFYYEENALHGFLIEHIRDYDAALTALEAFLPLIDNWAVCDQTSPKVFAKRKADILARARVWMHSDHTYTVRYGIEMLMRYGLDEGFEPDCLAQVADVHSEEYYINMMRAWFFATALAKQPEAVWPWLAEPRLDGWTRRKAIQKSLESLRIDAETKARLRALRSEL